MKTYCGNLNSRDGRSVVVQKEFIVNGQEGAALFYLDPAKSQQLFNHSPDGFSWGYSGSGPAQLALALLLDVGLEAPLALRLHQSFKESTVSRLGDKWSLTQKDIITEAQRLLREEESHAFHRN